MDRSYQAIDAVSLESFPWADLSIFQDEEMNAKGTSFFFVTVTAGCFLYFLYTTMFGHGAGHT